MASQDQSRRPPKREQQHLTGARDAARARRARRADAKSDAPGGSCTEEDLGPSSATPGPARHRRTTQAYRNASNATWSSRVAANRR
eukprot:7023950-Pyramimonas_sp.AAC.1